MGYIAALVAVLFWSFNVLVSKYLVDVLTPVQISFGRWIVASIVLFPFAIKSVINAWPIIKKNWFQLYAMSLMGVVLMNTFVYEAGHTASVIDMALIGTTGPVFLVIFSAIFLKKGIRKNQAIGLLIAIFGVLTIITKGHLFDLEHFTLVIGDLWMLTMTVTFGIYGVVEVKKIKGLSQLTLLAVLVFMGTLTLFPFFIGTLYTNPINHISWDVSGVIIYLGILNSLLAYFCWNVALDKIGALKCGMIYYLMPVFSTIEVHFLMAEQITRNQLIGGIFVFAGVFIAAYHKPKTQVTVERI